MGKEPRHPLALPDDTSGVGVAGWIAESTVRSYALRLAALSGC